MNSDEQVWNIAKWRFLQTEARLWLYSNKTLEIVFVLGIVLWVYFGFFSSGVFHYIKYLGGLLTAFSFLAMRVRLNRYDAFFDGYEQGFKDAASQNLDYWGSTHSQHTDSMAINSTLKEILKNEEIMSAENKEARNNEVKEGYSKLLGILLTWRKVK